MFLVASIAVFFATSFMALMPVVWLGERMTRLVPLRVVHIASAIVFLGLGLFALLG